MTPEIRAFEYALGLIAVLVGLAIADLANSLHKLMRARPAPRWDLRMILAALYAAVASISMWFNVWTIRDVAEVRTYFHYLWLILEFVLLYLLAAESLPDEPGAIDLATHYDDSRVRFWSIALAFHASVFTHWIYFSARLGRSPFAEHDAADVAYQAVSLTIPLVLLLVRNRYCHIVGMILLIAGMVGAFHAMALN